MPVHYILLLQTGEQRDGNNHFCAATLLKKIKKIVKNFLGGKSYLKGTKWIACDFKNNIVLNVLKNKA